MKKHWKQLLTVALVILLAAALSVSALAADGDEGGEEPYYGGTVEIEGLTASKYIDVKSDGTYEISLEAFSTGEIHTETVTVPADIILVLDVSGSMEDNIYNYTYTARASQGYTYNGYGNSSYYYKHTDGNYYEVSRHGGNGNRNLRITIGGTYYYLVGTDIQTTAPTGYGSNATIWTGVLYTRSQGTGQQKIDALKTAVKGFVDEVKTKNAEAAEAGAATADLSRIAIVKFSGNAAESNYADYVKGNTAYWSNYYNQYIEYSQVVEDLGVVTGDNAGDWKDTVDSLNVRGMTRADHGMGYAEAILNKYPVPAGKERSQVVVLFTDGEPNNSSGFDATIANNTVTIAKRLKDAGVTVYTIAVYQDASTAEPPTGNINQYLHAVSSNFPKATAYNDRGERGSGSYYYVADSADQLEKIFKEIGQSSGSTTSAVSSTAVMKDIVSSSFTLPEGAEEDDIIVKVVRWNSTTHDWGTGDGYVFTTDQWKTASLTYGSEEQENVRVIISDDGKTVDITGFAYSTHFKATKPEEDTDELDKVDGVNKNTAKITIVFPIQAKPSAVTGGGVETNGADSGIYIPGEDGGYEKIIDFPVPKVVFTPITYVVDYVTSDTTSDTKASSVKLDYTDVLADVDMLDDPSDDVLKGVDKTAFTYTIYKAKYGTISYGDDAQDVQRRYVRYVPTTMNWDDYDRIFIKGTSKSDSTLDVWAMLAVIPANNVYYEDTYITQTKTVHYNGKDVEIEYTGIGYEGTWALVGSEGANTTQHADATMGWISGLSDDVGYSNGATHVSNSPKSKATFTFAGTGVDIYSRTNGTTGTIVVTLKGKDADGNTVAKAQMIDTKSSGGDYYQVPVCTFENLPWGHYDVTITVSGVKKEGRLTFYLDGIRVYNPIQPHEDDGVVEQVYGAAEMGAEFTTIRSMLGDGTATAAAVFIDEITTETTTETPPDLERIAAAAAAVAAAQADKDHFEGLQSAYINAGTALTDATTAQATAVTSEGKAHDDYDAAVAALNALDPEDPDYDTKKAAAEAAADVAEKVWTDAKANLEDANTTLAEAQTAYTAAKAAWFELVGEDEVNKDTVAADIAQALTEAQEEYAAANEGVKEISQSTEAIATTYDKEGPKSEVYLSKNQSVEISVQAGKNYYVAMKEISGSGTTATINGAAVSYTYTYKDAQNVEHTVTVNGVSFTSDLYYEAVPSGGKIVIKNTGDGILALTKLRTTGGGSGAKAVPVEEMMEAYRAISAMSAVPYTGAVLTEEEATAPAAEPVAEEPAVETEPAAESEVTVVELTAADIVIENPAPAQEPEAEAEPEPEAPAAEPEPEAPAAEPEPEPAPSTPNRLATVLKSFFGFFRR